MMKKLVTLLFFLMLGLVAAGLVAPSLINWNDHKDKVTARLEKYIDRKVDIGGDIKISLIPQPQFLFGDVRIADKASDKPDTPPVIKIKTLEARLRMKDLLDGRIAIDEINLVEPEFNIVSDASGVLNTDGLLKSKDPDAPVAPGIDLSAGAIELQKVTITEGAVHYASQRTKTDIRFDHINTDIAANTLAGPFQVRGQLAFQDKPVNVTADIGLYDGQAPASVSVSLQPTEGLPEVSFTGSVHFGNGVVDGTLKVSQGTVVSLMPKSFLSSLPFMYQIASVDAQVHAAGDEWKLDDIKGKFGKGSLSGRAGIGFSKEGAPLLSANLSASGLELTADGVLPDLPAPFLANIKLKGKNIRYQGMGFEKFDVDAESNDKSWDIKSLHLGAGDKSDIHLVGVITPAKKSTILMGSVQSDDVGAMIKSLALGENHPLLFLQSSPFGKKIQASLSLDIFPDKVRIYDVRAAFDGKINLTGSADVSGDVAGIQAKIDQYQIAGLTMKDITIVGALKKDEIQFTKLAGQSPSGEFDLKGQSARADGKRDFTLEGSLFGGKAYVSGHETTAADGGSAYTADIDIKGQPLSSAEGILGLPFSGFLVKAGQTVDWRAGFSGTAGSYKLDNLKIKSGADEISGVFEKAGNTYSAAIEAGLINVTALLEREDAVPVPVSLALKGKTLRWRDIDIGNPALSMKVAPGKIDISDLRGSLYGGILSAASHAEKKDKTWSGTLSGDMSEIDLSELKDLMEIQGISFTKGNIHFDLASSGAKFLDLFKDVSGSVSVESQGVTIPSFAPDKLAAGLGTMASVPPNFQAVVNDAIKNQGATTYAPFKADLVFKDGVVSFDKISMAGDGHAVTFAGKVDLPSYKYDLTGDIQLKKPEGVPAFQIKRTASEVKKPSDYAVDIRAVEEWMTRKLAPVKAPEPPKETVGPPTPVVPESPIRGILQRLDAPPATGGEDQAAPTDDGTPVEQEDLPSTETAPAQ